jgi:Tol biopolymer transport system component
VLGKRALGLLLAVAAVGLASTASAEATFPGSNGRIAFSQGGPVPPVGGESGDPSEHSQVFTIDPGGGGLAQLTHVASDQRAGAPDWSPDGQRIVYESNESGSFEIWSMDSNGDNQTQLTNESVGFEDFLPSWSPNGKRILFSHCGEPFGPGFIAYCDIDVMNANGGGVKTLLSAGHWVNIRAEYSPDGNRIAFSSDRGGLQSAVWVMKADGSEPHRLTPPRLRAVWPDWAPSGKRILFGDNCCIPHSNLWKVKPNGGGLRQVTHVPSRLDANFASFSPNGRRIALFFTKGCMNSPCRHFYIFHADGSHHHKVATGKPDTFLTDWGPG